MALLLKILLFSIILLFTGCDTIKKYLQTGDTFVETSSGDLYSCVADEKTCIKTCDILRKDGLKIKQTFKMSPDLCKIPE